MNERESLTQPEGVSLVYKYSSDVHCVQQAAECKQMVSIQEQLVYILQPTEHTVQRNWISRLGKNL